MIAKFKKPKRWSLAAWGVFAGLTIITFTNCERQTTAKPSTAEVS